MNLSVLETICPICGNKFIPRRRTTPGKTCSRRCAAKKREAAKATLFSDNYFLHKGKMRAGGPETRCAVCEKIFRPLLADWKRNRGKCCSKQCAHQFRSQKLTKERGTSSVFKNGKKVILAAPRECKNCNIEFTPLYSRVLKGQGIYCGHKCRAAHLKSQRPSKPTLLHKPKQTKSRKRPEVDLFNYRVYASGQKVKLASERPCLNCGTAHRPTLQSDKLGHGQFCSTFCKAKYLAFQKAVAKGIDVYEVVDGQRLAPKRECLYCSKEFRPTIDNAAKGWGKYCNKSCSSKHRAALGTLNILQNRIHKTPISCHECGKEFLPKNKATRFCSRKCGAVDRSKKTQINYVTCLYCSKVVPTQHKTRKFCSRKCSGSYAKESVTPQKLLSKTREKLRFFCYGSLSRALKGKMKQARTRELLGYTVEELRLHIEKQFEEGMGWHNWSKYGWHIDHIRPVSSFSIEASIKEINSLKNLRPLWWRQNLLKSSRID
jgi:ribosomal protein S26